MGESMRHQLERIQSTMTAAKPVPDGIHGPHNGRLDYVPRTMAEWVRVHSPIAEDYARIQGDLITRGPEQFGSDFEYSEWKRKATFAMRRCQSQLTTLSGIKRELSTEAPKREHETPPEQLVALVEAKVAGIEESLRTKPVEAFASDVAYETWRRRAERALIGARDQLEAMRKATGIQTSERPQPAAQANASEQALKELRAKLQEETDRANALSASTAQARMAIEFVEVARIVLGEQTFNRIQARARDRVVIKPARQ